LSELRDYWEEYKKIELSGVGRNKRAYALEVLIHEKQKEIKSDPYDFDKRWEKAEAMGTPTISGPPDPNSKPEPEKQPRAEHTWVQAKEDIGENDIAMLDGCAKWAEDRMVYLAHVLDVLNPDNSNVARRGQGINIAIAEFNRRKAE